MNKGYSFLIQLLLKKNKIIVDNDELEFQMLSHPSYPSLHSITGVLNHFKVENLALDIPKNIETLAQLPESFLAHIENDEGEQLTLVVKTGLTFQLIYNKKKTISLSANQFLEIFTGIIVAIEKDENIITSKKGNFKFTNVLPYFTVSLYIGLFFWFQPSSFASIHFLLSLVGVAISVLIIQNDFGIDSKFMDRICSEESKITNCNAVLKSKGAILFNGIKLSDASFTYFTGLSIAWLLISIARTSYNPIVLISFMPIPVAVYSVYYQYAIAKRWCTLCLGITSILLLQVVSLAFFNVSMTTFSLQIISSVLLIFSFFITSAIWAFISFRLKIEKDFKALKIKNTKFKRNFNLFNTLLEKSNPLNIGISNTSEIIFGNKKAPLHITVITNPFCGHCKVVHTLVEDILKTHSRKVQICIRFNVNTVDEQNVQLKITSRILEIYHETGVQESLKALHDIYGGQSPNDWFGVWKNCNDRQKYVDVLQKENEWCVENNINFTPEILINGRSFPKEYDRSDLLYFIEELNENYLKNVNINTIQKEQVN